jgi:RNA polymerase sigma-70 factor (ECF subfamily)
MVTDDSAEDAALARRIARGGDPAAEAELCRRLVPRVRGYGRRHADPATASDLAQHVLVVVIEALRADRVERPEQLAAFVLATCRHTVRHWQRLEHRRSALLERYGDGLAPAAEGESAGIDKDRLGTCLERLAPRDRAIVVGTYFVDRDAGELARELGMSAGNVRVARHRALARLLACVEGG